MIPYTSFLFFYVMSLVLAPAIILGLLGKNTKYYGLLASLFILFLIFGQSREQTAYLVVFYLVNLLLVRVYSRLNKQYSGRWLILTVVFISLLPLLVAKVRAVFSTNSLGFLGLSYVTFRVVQILLEIHDGLIEEVPWFDFTYFILFFPTFSSGPIDRSRRFMQDLHRKYTSKEYLNLLGDGIYKLFIGLGYKFVIGYAIATYWLEKIPHDHTFLHTINYMYAYGLYLFFDFAGYSLIAIGASYLLGIITPENFNKPFLSKDMKEFWQRWHMSLSFWFRDFIYTRFVMTALRNKWFRNKFTASYLGYLITFCLMGAWHGLQVHYLVYGFYEGLLIVLTDYYQRKSAWYKKYKSHWLMSAVSVLVTLQFMFFGFLLFSGYLFN